METLSRPIDQDRNIGTGSTGIQPSTTLSTQPSRRISFIIGAVIVFTGALGPIHELGHWILEPTATVEWKRTLIQEWNINQIHAGYLTEIIVWGIVASLAVMLPDKKKIVPMYALGSCVGAFLMFYVSSDLHTLGVATFEHYGLDVDEWMSRTMLKWTWVGPLFMSGPMLWVRYVIKE